jgi:hypothetical protein
MKSLKPPPRKKKILEKDIEDPVVRYAKSLGMVVYKFKSPAQRSVPDRIFFAPGGRVFLIEFKRPGGVTTDKQDIQIAQIKSTGVPVYVIDNIPDGKALIDAGLAGLL